MLSSPQTTLTPSFDFSKLSQNGKTMVEYVWIGGTGMDIRSKSKTYTKEVKSLEDVDDWNFDGSSTYLAPTDSSEVILKPVAMYTDPFRGAPNKLVLCETYYMDGRPTIANFRYHAKKILNEKFSENEPMFGVEQEYVMKTVVGTTWGIPLGFPVGGYPAPQGPYYCTVGAKYAFGRDVMEAHYRVCLAAGIAIYGTNSEVMPGQWEFQVGTCKGIQTADDLWMARYLLLRVGEYYHVDIDFSPKPVKGNWNGSGCHTNYSNTKTRNDTKMENILEQISKLEKSHKRMIKLYGEDNNERLTGKHETSSMDKFSSGVAHRGASVRIPLNTEYNGKGYYEDRRPASNMDPYVVCASLYSVTLLDNFGLEDMEKQYEKFLENKETIPVTKL